MFPLRLQFGCCLSWGSSCDCEVTQASLQLADEDINVRKAAVKLLASALKAPQSDSDSESLRLTNTAFESLATVAERGSVGDDNVENYSEIGLEECVAVEGRASIVPGPTTAAP